MIYAGLNYCMRDTLNLFYGVLILFFLAFSIFEMFFPGVQISDFDFSLKSKFCINVVGVNNEC
jgi:hypothetical protein